MRAWRTINPAAGNAITLSGGTVTVRGFAISAAAGTGVNITGGTGHTILRNNITGNTSGVVNATGSAANSTLNFWGAANSSTTPPTPAALAIASATASPTGLVYHCRAHL